MRGHQIRRISGLFGLNHQFLRALAVDAQVAADGVEERQRPANGEDFGRIIELVAELAGAREDRLELGGGPALHHPQRQAADHLQAQLLLLALRDHQAGRGAPSARARPETAPREIRTGQTECCAAAK